MRRGDFGAREAFFLLLAMVVAVALAWWATFAFVATVQFIGSLFSFLAFGVWLMFQ